MSAAPRTGDPGPRLEMCSRLVSVLAVCCCAHSDYLLCLCRSCESGRCRKREGGRGEGRMDGWRGLVFRIYNSRIAQGAIRITLFKVISVLQQ